MTAAEDIYEPVDNDSTRSVATFCSKQEKGRFEPRQKKGLASVWLCPVDCLSLSASRALVSRQLFVETARIREPSGIGGGCYHFLEDVPYKDAILG